VTPAHAREALAAAHDGPVAEGVVGAGTGMITMGHKAGIGTASRHLPGVGTVGVLLLCNFGASRDLRIGGVLVGAALAAAPTPTPDAPTPAPTLDQGGSCLGVVCTDIPLDARQLARVARRVGLGLARVGSVAHNGSGDIFCAVSTANRQGRDATGVATVELLLDGSINDVFAAVVDATEEAVCNALFVADTVTGVDGHVVPGLPVDRVLAMVRAARAATAATA
jgi:D-aminopeptidase